MSKPKKKTDARYKCPVCESTELLVYAQTSFNMNTGEFYCHSVKIQDSDADVRCMSCDWIGKRKDFSEEGESE
jgi:transcription elongation factor Elf1